MPICQTIPWKARVGGQILDKGQPEPIQSKNQRKPDPERAREKSVTKSIRDNVTCQNIRKCQKLESKFFVTHKPVYKKSPPKWPGAQGGTIKLDQQFISFAKFGDTKADGKTITLTQIDKWFKQAGVIDKKITTTDTGITFNKFKSKTIAYNDFLSFLEDLAKQKNLQVDTIKDKLQDCGLPGMNKATQAVKAGAVDRLTDTSKYTGSHKERFDEGGKGKGKEGREDIADDSGFVGGYKGQGTYDKK
ncbi:hypothetical protein JTB14_038185 [Gonioctena quinquepunctata]|nr:hypothetical protein JTB14_038185 [Gonioctena quinquepunctata]